MHSERSGRLTEEHRGVFGLRLIAALKFVKVVILTSVGVATVSLADHEPPRWLEESAQAVGPHAHWAQHLFEMLLGMDEHRLRLLGLGSFAYAAVFAVEGTGLWLHKSWCEYLTIFVTLSFLPLEGYELHTHFSVAKIATILLNVAAIVYLVVRLHHERSTARAHEPSAA